MAGKKKAGGRPTLYNPEMLPKIEEYARKGLTNEQIAKNLNISTTALYEWQNKYVEFANALKAGKEVADREVENALYKRATGYSCSEDKIFLGPGGQPVIVPTTKHYPPDPTSMIFWLKNRQPQKWRDRQEVEHSGKLEYEIVLPEELETETGKEG